MERLNCAALKRRIKNNVELYPWTIEYERTNDPYPRATEATYSDYLGESVSTNGGWSRVQRKYGFIYLVIFEKKYYNNEGHRLNISDAEIQSVFNKFARTLEVLEGFDAIDEFHSYLYEKALEVVKLEEHELEAYRKKTFVAKLIDNDSTLDLQRNEITRTSKDLILIDGKIRSMINDWKEKKITGSQMDGQRLKLDEAREFFRDKLDYLLEKYKRESESGHYKRRKLLKSCFDHRELYNLNESTTPHIRHRNLSTVTFMLEEYCRWHKYRFATEIAEFKKKPSAKDVEYQRRVEILMPYTGSSLSIKKIAEKTAISSSAVQRILSELRKQK